MFFPTKAPALAVAVALLGALAGGLTAGTTRSLSDLDIETAEAKMTLEKVLAENAALSNQVRQLQEKLAVQEATAARMTESLALATSESEVFRRQTGELKLRLEALGVEGGGSVTDKVERGYVTALNDLRHADEERIKLREALTGLSEAVLRFSKAPPNADPEARKSLDAPLRKANEALGDAAPGAKAPASATLSDGLVIGFSEELALVVTNIGAKQGVISGMPFQVLRDNHIIGSVRIVEVREKIAGAVIENLSSEKDRIKVGDHLKIAARQ